MNTKRSPYTLLRGRLLRAGLLFLAATLLMVGLWALPFPRAFYGDFPLPGWLWVSTLGPYNGHLVRDYGAMNLALAFLLGAAAIFLERRLILVALGAWLFFAVPHFVFHAGQTHHFSAFHNAAQLGSLGFQILLPLGLLVLAGTRGPSAQVRTSEKEA